MDMNMMKSNPYGQPPASTEGAPMGDHMAEMMGKLDYIIQMLEADAADDNSETEDSTGGESD